MRAQVLKPGCFMINARSIKLALAICCAPWVGLQAVGEDSPSFKPYSTLHGISMDLPDDWPEADLNTFPSFIAPTAGTQNVVKVIQQLDADGVLEAHVSIAFLEDEEGAVSQAEVQTFSQAEIDEIRRMLPSSIATELSRTVAETPGIASAKSLFAGFVLIDGYYCVRSLSRWEYNDDVKPRVVDVWQCDLEDAALQIAFSASVDDRQKHLPTFSRILQSIDFPDL